MILLSNVKVPHGFDFSNLLPLCAREMKIDKNRIKCAKLHRRSIDARKRNDLHFLCSFLIEMKNEEGYLSNCNLKNVSAYAKKEYNFNIKKTPLKNPPVVVGFGPAGMFAALTLAKAGLHPIVIERGEAVDARQKSVENFWKNSKLNPDSNIQFGEGGAGTFSDGKLTTGIKDPRCGFVLKEFFRHGANEDILYDAKPHIGTDVLCKIVKSIREEIITLGGEVRFSTTLKSLLVSGGKVCGALIESEGKTNEIISDHIILAVGHSARDTFYMLKDAHVEMCRKPFSVGARIEHLQSDIDRSQLGEFAKYPDFTPMDYKLSHHTKGGRGVYTFCMCPGGVVVNAASEENTIVTNGMSYRARDGKNANSALLVSVNPEDFGGDDVLAGVEFQREIEKKAYTISNSYRAPAQRLGDFLKGSPSKKFGSVTPSFPSGVVASSIDLCLPQFVTEAMKEGILAFDKKLRGFANPDAILTAPETRSSSPVRIIRGEGFEASILGLLPCGEGAGYAGGIMSAAVDGIRCAESIIERI